MKKYLVVLRKDVADEGYVGLIKVVTQKQLDKVKSVETRFGQIDGESYKFQKTSAKEISDEELKVLEKFKLTNLEFGSCALMDEDDTDIFDFDDDNED